MSVFQQNFENLYGRLKVVPEIKISPVNQLESGPENGEGLLKSVGVILLVGVAGWVVYRVIKEINKPKKQEYL